MPLLYQDQKLYLRQGGVDVDLLELTKKIKQPFYLYDVDGALERLQFFKEQTKPMKVYFSLKANHYPPLVSALLKEGCGLDIVSGGELNLALEMGLNPKKMVFSGVGKTKQELELAIEAGVFQINVESLEELCRLGELAQSLNTKIGMAFRLNPNIKLSTHEFIQTGTSDHKFGMEEALLPEFSDIVKKFKNHLHWQGLAMHIGSQGLDLDPILQAMAKTKNIFERLRREGFALQTLDVGGGVGIDYHKLDEKSDEERICFYGEKIRNLFKDFKGELLCEPGRIVTARFGLLFGEIQYLKKTSLRHFVILNTGMNHLLRPALYQAFHPVLPLLKREGDDSLYTIAGPICESADILARDRKLPPLKSGDWLVFLSTGAYGAVMAAKYNLNYWPPKELALSKGKEVV